MGKDKVTVPEDAIFDELKRKIDDLYNFCLANGIVPDHDTLGEVVKSIKTMRVLNPTKKYTNVNIDEFGYICKIGKLEELVTLETKIPTDAEDGYYKLEGNKIVLDPVRKDHLYPDSDRF